MTVTDLAVHLQSTVANLEGYIERRAEELAAPMVVAADDAAAERVRTAELDARRQRDLAAELRRQLDAALQRRDEAWQAGGEVAARLHRHSDCPDHDDRTDGCETCLDRAAYLRWAVNAPRTVRPQ